MDLDSIYLQFPADSDCVAHLEALRWGDKPMCPYCKRKSSTPIKNESRHHCNVCNLAFSVTVGTLFHGTRLPLQKWFLAINLILENQKDPSVRELATALEVNKNTASFVLRRIRSAFIPEINLLLAVATENMKGER
jgi:transposase-like protein